MRNLVIAELMAMIDAGAEIVAPSGMVATDLKTLESISNRELLNMLLEAVEFQG